VPGAKRPVVKNRFIISSGWHSSAKPASSGIWGVKTPPAAELAEEFAGLTAPCLFLIKKLLN
jgi:hypothetical protein